MEVTGKATFTISTKRNKDELNGTKTAVTIVWDGCTIEVLKALAVQALVVKIQGIYRRKGVPERETIHVMNYAPGTKHGGVDLLAEVKGMSSGDLLAAFSPQQKAELIAKLQAEIDAK